MVGFCFVMVVVVDMMVWCMVVMVIVGVIFDWWVRFMVWVIVGWESCVECSNGWLKSIIVGMIVIFMFCLMKCSIVFILVFFRVSFGVRLVVWNVVFIVVCSL